MSFSIAFLIGPSIGAYFSIEHRRDSKHTFDSKPANFAVLISLVELILVVVFLPETKKVHFTDFIILINELNVQSAETAETISSIVPTSFNSLFSFDFIKSEINRLALKSYAQIYFLFLLLFSGLEFTLSFLTHTRFEFTSHDQGNLSLIIAK